jgi:hypothetical protein
MSRYVVKFAEGRYCEWSSVTDSPLTYLTDTKEEALAQFEKEDVEMADKIGCSCCGNCSSDYSGPSHVEQLLSYNAAGLNEESIRLDEILKLWSKPKENKNVHSS